MLSTLIVFGFVATFTVPGLCCRPKEYAVSDGPCCPMCHEGSQVYEDCTEFRTTSCLPCTEGTFMNQPTGRARCYTCTNCDAGSGLKIKTSCTTTSDTVCEPLEGFYCVDSAEDGCVSAQKHTSCQPGQYISQKGTALTDTVCSDCSGGTFSDGTFTSCQLHTQCESMNRQLIKPGTVSMDAECGEQSSNTTRIMIAVVVGGVVVVVLFLLIGTMYYLKKKKKGCLNIGRIRNADNPKQEPSEETSVMILERC